MVDGAAGDEDKRGFGESTVPKARLPLGTSLLPPTIKLPFLPIATGLVPAASFDGEGEPEATLEEGLDAGGPRDQADALAEAWLGALSEVDEGLLICVRMGGRGEGPALKTKGER